MPGTYPPDWPAVAERIKRAAGNRCEHCGHAHEPASGYTLTVHHLNGDKSDCAWRNLVALCQRCHLSIQGRWQPGQPWLFDAPRWAVIRGHALPTRPDGRALDWNRMNDLTPVDHELLKGIEASAGADGAAHSLFQLAVVQLGMHYPWALYRLKVLAMLGLVQVERPGRGRPLSMRVRR